MAPSLAPVLANNILTEFLKISNNNSYGKLNLNFLSCRYENDTLVLLNPLSANPTKWSNTLK